MDEILNALRSESFVLDLGCAEGSFPASATAARVVRVDRELPRGRDGFALFVQADADRRSSLPRPEGHDGASVFFAFKVKAHEADSGWDTRLPKDG